MTQHSSEQPKVSIKADCFGKRWDANSFLCLQCDQVRCCELAQTGRANLGRSRPHPAPAVNRNKDGNLTLTYDEYSLAEHDAAIARKAREEAQQRIDAFKEWFAAKCRKVRPYRQLFTEDEISEQIALLQADSPQQQAGDQHE